MWRHCIQILEFDKIRRILSLYAVTALGKGRALELQPQDDLYEVDKALALTTEMKSAISAGLHLPLGEIRDVLGQVNRAEAGGGPLSPDDLWAISQTLRGANDVGRALGQLDRHAFPNIRRLGARVPRLSALTEQIVEAIDPSGIVRDSASTDLQETRQRLAELRRRIKDRLQNIVNSPTLRTHLQYPNYTVVRNRYVLPVNTHSRGGIDGIVHGHSDSGATIYIEPDSIVSLGNQVSDLESAQEKEEKRIRWRLTRAIGRQAGEIQKALDIVTNIDVASARAHMSIEYDMREPKLVDDISLELRGARHPLLMYLSSRKAAEDEEVQATRRPAPPNPQDVVPMDIHLGEEFDVLIITGPNTGGKTVAIKCLGLLCLMARAGMHVTAEKARIPCYDFIYADIGDEQSLEQSLSTFSSHLSHIVEFLANATNRSLVLLDELGAGTDPIEGAALGRVVVEELASRGTSAVITTHLGELKQLGFTLRGVENSCMQFDAETLQPTYELKIGTPGRSNALEIARNLGFPVELLERARARTTELETESTERMMAQIERTRSEAEERLQRAHQVETEAEELKQEYDETLERLREEEMRKGAGWALQVRDTLDELQQQTRQLYDDFRFSHKRAAKQLKKLDKSLRALRDKVAGTIEERSPHRELEPGDEVYIPKLHRWGTVVRLKKRHGTVVVSYGQATAELLADEVVLWENLSQGETQKS